MFKWARVCVCLRASVPCSCEKRIAHEHDNKMNCNWNATNFLYVYFDSHDLYSALVECAFEVIQWECGRMNGCTLCHHCDSNFLVFIFPFLFTFCLMLLLWPKKLCSMHKKSIEIINAIRDAIMASPFTTNATASGSNPLYLVAKCVKFFEKR